MSKIQQFNDLKAKHPDALLMFRCDSSYELYFQDAKEASVILGLSVAGDALTTLSFNAYKLDIYLPKLIRAGKRIAICDQLCKPAPKKVSISSLPTPTNY